MQQYSFVLLTEESLHAADLKTTVDRNWYKSPLPTKLMPILNLCKISSLVSAIMISAVLLMKKKGQTIRRKNHVRRKGSC